MGAGEGGWGGGSRCMGVQVLSDSGPLGDQYSRGGGSGSGVRGVDWIPPQPGYLAFLSFSFFL